MYAVFQSGGKQYKAEPGAVVRLERLPGNVGENVVLDRVLLVVDGENTRLGQPVLENTIVRGRIVEQGRLRKVIIFKHKRRKDYRKKQGHRQYFTGVLIEGIGEPGEQVPVSQPDSAEGGQE